MTSSRRSQATLIEWSKSVPELLRSRRTVHEFEADCPPREIIVAAIDHARWAPNHHRTEPWKFYLLSPQKAEALAVLNADLVRSAKVANSDRSAAVKLKRWRAIPGWLVLTCQHSEDTLREREDYAACCCAAQNLALYLWAYGIGVKWTTGAVARVPQFFELLDVDPATESVVGLFCYGFPAAVPTQQRKPLSDVLVEFD